MRQAVVAVVLSVLSWVVPLGPAAAQKTLKVVMHSDLKILDPIWSGAYIVRQHGYLVYDTLFAIDDKFQVKPQMAEGFKVSDDGLTYTITLRDGLTWHDGAPVTAEDCVASLKRWAARDSMGVKLADATAAWTVVDANSFQIVLKEKFGAVIDAIGKPSVVVPFMMPKRIAETDPFKQAAEVVGSGPYIFKRDEWKPGDKVVYVKNPTYKPRSEPAAGLSGGKVATARSDRVGLDSRSANAVNALINGEIDMIESLSHDLIPVMAKNKAIEIARQPVINQYQFRMNWLHPPFNNVAVRRAAMMALSQTDFLNAAIGNKDYFRLCKALFTCGGPHESAVGMDGLIEGDTAKARPCCRRPGMTARRW